MLFCMNPSRMPPFFIKVCAGEGLFLRPPRLFQHSCDLGFGLARLRLGKRATISFPLPVLRIAYLRSEETEENISQKRPRGPRASP